ncbi:MAG: dienelactone hydrolase family protein [Pseudomonadota bacterium]
MCDEQTARDADAYAATLSRRRFTGASLTVAAGAALPGTANAKRLTERDVRVPTPDGEADAFFVAPTRGRCPGVLIWPDILGLRPAFRQMARRLAGDGYAVLVVNPYYRQARSPVVEEGASFRDPATRERVMPLARSLTAATNERDARAFVAFLDAQPESDPRRKIGTMGYCMGAAMTVRSAAAQPDRIGAGASFHGGRLVTDRPDSPHLLVPTTKASYLYAIADNDDKQQPDAKDALRAAYADASLDAEIEVYEGAMHGWCVPDSAAYHEQQAERAWARLLVLFSKALR